MKHKWELKGRIRIYIYGFFTFLFAIWLLFMGFVPSETMRILTIIFMLILATFIIIDSIYFFLFEEKEQKEYRQYLIEELANKKIGNTNENNCVSTIKNDNKDIIALMLKNNDEITEYFKISKNQARFSFLFSVIFCLVGIAFLAFGICGIVFLENASVSVISLIGGSLTEFISGTIFWLHNKSALQLNHYYDALHENEKFLSAVNIADKLSDEKREDILVEIIRKQISCTLPKIESDNDKEK